LFLIDVLGAGNGLGSREDLGLHFRKKPAVLGSSSEYIRGQLQTLAPVTTEVQAAATAGWQQGAQPSRGAAAAPGCGGS